VALVAAVLIDMFCPAGSALVADLLSAADRVRGYGLIYWAVNIGFAAGALLGGALAQHSFKLLFAVDAAASVAFIALLLAGVPRRPHRAAEEEGQSGGLGTVLRDRLLVALALVQIAHSAVYLQAFTTLPLAMRDAGLSTAAYGAIIGLNGALIVVAQPLLVAWMGRRDRARMLAGSSAVLGAGFAIDALAGGAAVFVTSVVVWTVGEMLGAAVASALVADLAPPGLRGRYLGVFSAAWGIAAVVAPLAGTAIYQHAGATALWLGCGGLGLAAAAGVLSLGPALRSRPPAVAPM
jgi:MFS family permease